MNELKKEQIKAIVWSSIFIIFGVLFCAMPSKMMTAIETIVCVSLIVYGVVNIFVYCLVNSESKEIARLLKGAVATGIAILLMFVNAVFVFCLGLVVVISGVIYIVSAVKDKKAEDKKWWTGLVIGIVLSVVGLAISILFNTKITQNIVMVIFGITLIADGVVRLIYIFVAHREIHSILTQLKNEETIEPEYSVQPAKEEKVQNDVKNEEKIVEKIEKKTKKEEKKAEKPVEGFGSEEESSEKETQETEEDDDDTEGFV